MTLGTAISVTELAASYGRGEVWSEATFEIPAGSFAAVVGPNGAGKSTLFRILLGLVRPARGQVRVFGSSPRRGDPAIGYMPQSHAHEAAVPVLGRDLVALGVDGHRWGLPFPGPSMRAKWQDVDSAIAAVSAGSYADRPLTDLSGGEQQRLHLAQALVGDPRLLLLDEPLSHLDVRNQTRMADLIERLRRERELTVLLIAHDINPLLPFVDTVIFVSHHRLTCGEPRAVINTQSLSRLYDAPVEVLTDSRGRVFVVGLEEEAAHPHPASAEDPAST